MGSSRFLQELAKHKENKGVDARGARTEAAPENAPLHTRQEDIVYQKYLENRKKQPKLSGGTANPILTTADVRENRNLTRRESPTYAAALAKNQSTAARLGAGLENAEASAQDVKEILFSGRNYGTANPTFSLGKEYDTMTEKEAGIYTGLAKQGRKADAAAYLDALQMDLNRRNAAQMQERTKQTAQRNPLGGIGMDVAGAMSSGAGAAYSLWQEAKGEAIDPYHPAFGGAITQAGAQEGLLGDSSGAARLLKQAALAAAEWGGQALGYGIFAPAAMAAGAAGTSMQDAAMRGGTAEEAAFYGLTSGAAEMAAEKLGFDRYLGILDKIAPAKGNKAQIAKMIAKEMGAEGMEEGATEIANILADMAIMGEKSSMKGIYREAQASGKSKEAAAWEAMQAAAGQIGESFAVGAISGGMIGGGLAGADIAAGKDPLARARAQYEAATRPAETAAEKPAEAMETAAEMPVEAVEKPVEKGTEQPMETAEAIKAPDTHAKKQAEEAPGQDFFSDLEGYGEKYYGEKGRELYIRRARETGTLDHTAAFNTYYRAGIAGLTEKEIRQTAYTAAADKLLLNEAWMAGAADRKAEIANAIRGRSKWTGKRGLLLGEDVKATEAQLALAKLYADIGGAQIRLVNHIDAGEGYHVNGMQEKDTITIALDADSFSGALHHEMIHYIKRVNPESYYMLQDVVFLLANESKIDMDAQMEDYRSRYEGIYGEDAEMTAYMEEITADAFEKLAADRESLKSLLFEIKKKDPTLLERIKEFLEKMAQTLESLFKDNTFTDFAEAISKDRENLKKLQQAFVWALAETGKMETEEGGAADIRYQVNPNFPAQYDAWDGKSRTTFYIGTTSKALQDIGIQTKKIIWKSEKIKKIKEKHSGMTDEIIKQVPHILENPIIVMKSLNQDGKGDSRITLFGEIEDINGVPVVMALELLPKSKEKEILNIQIIASVYGKTSNIKGFIEKSEVLYLDENKKRTDTWLQSVGLQLPSGTTKYGSIGSVTYQEDAVKIKGTAYADLVGNEKITPAPPLMPAYNRNNGMATFQSGATTNVIKDSIAQDGEESNDRNITKFAVDAGDSETDAVGDDAKFSIRYTENNHPFVEIEEDILDGVPQKEWAKTVKKTLKTKFPNGIQIRNENIRINGRQTASEMTKSKYAQWLAINSPSEYADKLRFANHADEILYTAQNWKGEKINHPRKDNIVEFARADALIRISGRGYSADVVVGTTSDSGMVLYDILYLKPASINEKKQEQTAVHSKKEISTEIVAPVSENSITQDGEESNDRNITKFSIRKDDIDAAIGENEDWRAAYEGLLKEFEITREPLKDRESARKVARKFLKSIHSGYDEDTFLERFISLCNYGADMQSDSSYRDLLTAMTMLAEDALQESLEPDTTLYDEYAELRKAMRTTTIFISEDTKRDLAAQDIKYSDLRKENFGKMKLSGKNGIGIDTQYAEWAEQYPALFQSDGATSQAELPAAIGALLYEGF